MTGVLALDLGFELALLPPGPCLGVLAGALAGAAAQRLADPETPPGRWLHAAPWLGALVVALAMQVATSPMPAAGRGAVLDQVGVILFLGYVALFPTGAVALAQLAAAVAGRGRPAPLRRFASLARAAITLGALVWIHEQWSPVVSPQVLTGLLVMSLPVLGCAAMARRPGAPGASLVIVGALIGARAGMFLGSLGEPTGGLGVSHAVAQIAVLLVAVGTAGVLVVALRLLRIDARALAALGVDVAAPGELYAALCALIAFSSTLLVSWFLTWVQANAASAERLMAVYVGTEIVIEVAMTALFIAALAYLRGRLDAAEAFHAARLAHAPAAPALPAPASPVPPRPRPEAP